MIKLRCLEEFVPVIFSPVVVFLYFLFPYFLIYLFIYLLFVYLFKYLLIYFFSVRSSTKLQKVITLRGKSRVIFLKQRLD